MSVVTAHRRTLPVAAAVTAAVLTAVVLGASPAQAHTVLTASTPARGATVTEALDVVTFTFNEPVGFPQVGITGPGGERLEEGAPVDGGRSVEQRLHAAAAPGTYTVSFRVSSDDGHPIDGQFAFTYAGPVAARDVPDASAGAVPDGGAVPDEGAGVDVGTAMVIVMLLALLGFAGAVVFAARRRADDTGPPEGTRSFREAA